MPTRLRWLHLVRAACWAALLLADSLAPCLDFRKAKAQSQQDFWSPCTWQRGPPKPLCGIGYVPEYPPHAEQRAPSWISPWLSIPVLHTNPTHCPSWRQLTLQQMFGEEDRPVLSCLQCQHLGHLDTEPSQLRAWKESWRMASTMWPCREQRGGLLMLCLFLLQEGHP